MVLDNWIYFDCFARTAVLLKFLRKQLVIAYHTVTIICMKVLILYQFSIRMFGFLKK